MLTNLPLDPTIMLANVCLEMGITSLYAFGSRAKEASRGLSGEQPQGLVSESDLDIAVQPGPGVRLTLEQKVRLIAFLEDLFHVAKVDLVVLPEVDPFLAVEALRGELLYCQDEDRQAREELYYLAKAGDLADYERERMRGILEGDLRR